MSDIRKTERGLTSPPPPHKIRMRIGFPFSSSLLTVQREREREREKAILETYLFTHTTHREAQTR